MLLVKNCHVSRKYLHVYGETDGSCGVGDEFCSVTGSASNSKSLAGSNKFCLLGKKSKILIGEYTL